MRHVLLVLLLLLLAPSVGGAEEEPATRRIALPGEGLTVEVPAGWALEQYGPALLRVRKAQATLWFYAAEGADETSVRHLRRVAEQAARDEDGAKPAEPVRWRVPGAPEAMKLWYVQEGRDRFHGIVPTEAGGFYAEADLPGKAPALRKAVEAMLASVDAQPYAHPERHVDWTLGFTLDAAGEAWRAQRERDGRVRFRDAAQKGMLVVEKQGATVAAADTKARIDGLLEAMRRRLSASGLASSVSLDGEASEVALAGGTKATKAPVLITVGASQAMRGHVYVAGPFVVSTAAVANDKEALAAFEALAGTFRVGTHPGPQKTAAQPTSMLPKEGAPPVVFTVPDGWELQKPRTRMHAGQLKPSGENALSVDIYYFGAGVGGSLEANMARWRKQIATESEPTQTKVEVAEGIELTVLDAVGSYAGMRRNPHAPAGEGGKAGQRMIAAFMACPQGPLFFKVVGPKEEVTKILPDLMACMKSFRVKK